MSSAKIDGISLFVLDVFFFMFEYVIVVFFFSMNVSLNGYYGNYINCSTVFIWLNLIIIKGDDYTSCIFCCFYVELKYIPGLISLNGLFLTL